MPSIYQQLFEMAADIVRGMEARRPALEAELLQMKKRQAEIEGELHTTDLARKRLGNLPFKAGGDLPCPRCWISHETKSALRPRRSDIKDDFFECETCRLLSRIEMGH